MRCIFVYIGPILAMRYTIAARYRFE